MSSHMINMKDKNQNKIQKFKKENNNLSLNKFHSQLELILNGQEISRNEMKQSFIELAQQRRRLLATQPTTKLDKCVESSQRGNPQN